VENQNSKEPPFFSFGRSGKDELGRLGKFETSGRLISFIVAHKACRAAGIEQLGQDPLLLPRLAIGVPIFLLVALAIRYTLETEKGAR
jgi:hypothetical protein